MRHALMENRNGLIVGAAATRASGHAERLAAAHMIEPARRPARGRITVAGDKGYDTEDFVVEMRGDQCHPARRPERQRSPLGNR